MMLPGKKNVSSKIDDLVKTLLEEMNAVTNTIKETTLLIEQSRQEVAKLSQRNTAVNTLLQKIQLPDGNTSADEMRQAYETALDTQQRLFVMREQFEKFQHELIRNEDKQKILEKVVAQLKEATEKKEDDAIGVSSVEMMVNAQESERQKLSRQMHDGPAQALSNFILQTDIALRLMDIDEAQARKELEDLKTSAMNTFQYIRNFIFELRPMMLDDLGVVPTLRRYADTFKQQTGVDVSVTVTGVEQRIPTYLEVLIFRAMQELIGHAVHQNQASNIKILLNLDDKSIRLTVDDNGKGLTGEELHKDEFLGMKLIKERVEVLGGTWSMDGSPGLGTKIGLLIPIKA